MSTVQLDVGEPLLQMGAKPVALLFVTPEGILLIRWTEGRSPEDQSRVEQSMKRGVRFGDLEL